MKIAQISPKPTGKCEFSFSKTDRVPTHSGCYALTSFSDHILYFGKATNLRSRMQSHLSDPAKAVKTEHGVAFWFYFFSSKGNDNLDAMERGLLNQFELYAGVLPPLNKVHSPVY